jgi:hypothetical protein
LADWSIDYTQQVNEIGYHPIVTHTHSMTRSVLFFVFEEWFVENKYQMKKLQKNRWKSKSKTSDNQITSKTNVS